MKIKSKHKFKVADYVVACKPLLAQVYNETCLKRPPTSQKIVAYLYRWPLNRGLNIRMKKNYIWDLDKRLLKTGGLRWPSSQRC